jgi:hypothetical protein
MPTAPLEVCPPVFNIKTVVSSVLVKQAYTGRIAKAAA